jgi:hypothetical protein
MHAKATYSMYWSKHKDVNIEFVSHVNVHALGIN